MSQNLFGTTMLWEIDVIFIHIFLFSHTFLII